MPDHNRLITLLEQLDGRSYKAYSQLRGEYTFPSFSLHVDHIQGDPFAAPSRVRVRMPQKTAAIPDTLMSNRIRSMALADWLARRVNESIGHTKQNASASEQTLPRHRGRSRYGTRGRGSGKSNLIFIDAGGQEVLERTAVKLEASWVEIRLEVGLPAAGRRILGAEATHLLTHRIPHIVEKTLRWKPENDSPAKAFVECIENQESIRAELTSRGLIAFVADGSLLPRMTGASNRPMPLETVVPFRSPDSQAVEFEVPNPLPPNGHRRIRGLGIAAGVTLIVGGGYHGKSTLLHALEHGVYPHIPGDGREYVVSSPHLVKTSAEDGRSVQGVDIHAFIDALPDGLDKDKPKDKTRTRFFSTQDASGSTSQAAAIMEAIEAGASGLLLDEDTCATNFMLRDGRMQKLVHLDDEPITPFVDRIREVFESFGVSTVLVMGGSGDYFEVADYVIMMKNYSASDVTEKAQQIATEYDNGRKPEFRSALRAISARCPVADSLVASKGRKSVKISARSREQILYGDESLDLRHLTQIVDTSQTHAIGRAIHLASEHLMGGTLRGASNQMLALHDVLDALDAIFDDEGLDILGNTSSGSAGTRHPGRFARPRRHEIAAALNRMRSLKVKPAKTVD